MSRTAGSWCPVRYVALGQVTPIPAATYTTSSNRCRAAGRAAMDRHPRGPDGSVPAVLVAVLPLAEAASPAGGAPAVRAVMAGGAPVACGAAVSAPGPRPAQFAGSLLSTVPQSLQFARRGWSQVRAAEAGHRR